MGWITLSAVALFILVILTVRVRIKREYGREASEDAANVRAYGAVCRIPAFGYVRHVIIAQLKRWQATGWLLDAGCGPGHLVWDIAIQLDCVRAVGLDINRDMLGLARGRVRGIPIERRPGLCLGEVQALSIKDASLDVVVSTLSLHHWPDTVAALKEFNRVLKPGGRFLILDLKRDTPLVMYAFMWTAQALSPRPIREGNAAIGSLQASYTAAELGKLIASGGFREFSVTPHFAWLVASGKK